MGILNRGRKPDPEAEAALTAAIERAAGEALPDDVEETTPTAALIEPEETTAARLQAILTDLNVQNRISTYNQELSAIDDDIRALLSGEATAGKLALNLQKSIEKAAALARKRDNLADTWKFVQQIDDMTDRYREIANNTVYLCEIRLRATALLRQIAAEEWQSRHELETATKSLHRQAFSLREKPEVAEPDLDRIQRAIEEVREHVTPVLKQAGAPPQV